MKILFKLFSLKLIASLLGLLYSILQVRYFGASRVIEIYFAAQSMVYLVTSLTQSGQLAEVFLPEYHKLNNIEEGLGYKGLNIVINRMVLFGSILIVLIFAFAHYVVELIVPGFSLEDKEFTVQIFRILLPVLYLALMNSFYITVLNAEERFGRAELLGLTNSIVNILALIILYPFIQLWALVISFILGKVIEFIFYVWQLFKNGYRFQLTLSIPEFDHISFFKTMQSTLLYVVATQVYSIVLTANISFLPEGVYAIFKYVQNLSNKIKGLFVQPFMTIFFTKYSMLLQKAKSVFGEFTKNMTSIININAIVIIGTVVLGDFIVHLIWGSKKFDEDDVRLAYIFMLFNIVAVSISSIGSIYRKMAVAHGRAKKLYLFWVIAQLLSAVFSFILIKYFKTNGLFVIIPINVFFMSVISFIVYKSTKESIKYDFLNKHNLLILTLITIAILLKYFIGKYLNFNYELRFVLFFLIVLILSLYPMYSTYKVLKSETVIN